MSDLNLHDFFVLVLATFLLVIFFYIYNYYLKLRRRVRIMEAEYARNKMLRPIGLPPFLASGKSLLPALAVIVYLGIVSIVLFSTLWIGLFWFVCAALVVWFNWIQPLFHKKPDESSGESTSL